MGMWIALAQDSYKTVLEEKLKCQHIVESVTLRTQEEKKRGEGNNKTGKKGKKKYGCALLRQLQYHQNSGCHEGHLQRNSELLSQQSIGEETMNNSSTSSCQSPRTLNSIPWVVPPLQGATEKPAPTAAMAAWAAGTSYQFGLPVADDTSGWAGQASAHTKVPKNSWSFLCFSHNREIPGVVDYRHTSEK